MSFQTVVLVGRLGRDPEMRYTPSGAAVTSFSVATDRRYTGADGQSVQETTWFRISVFGKQAESCNQYLTKGKLVLVEGRLTPDPATGGPRIWTDKENRSRASFEVFASTVRFLSSRSEATSGAADGDMDEGEPGAPAGEDGIPF